MIGNIVNNKHVEAAAPSDAATQSATQFKPAVTNALGNTSTVGYMRTECLQRGRRLIIVDEYCKNFKKYRPILATISGDTRYHS